MEQIYAAVIGQEKLASDVYSMWLDAGDMARASRPGQFICLYSKDQAHLLPRPISICEVDEKRGALRIVYRVVGYGTEEFSRAKAGERINPLEIRPFFKEVIFFDATDKEQRSRVRRFTQARDAAVKGYIGRIYISTRFDPEKGWDGYKELTDWLQAPLYQLQPGLAGRFGVVRVPSVVTADNDRKVFVVQELGKEKEKTARPNQDESEASAAKGEESK